MAQSGDTVSAIGAPETAAIDHSVTRNVGPATAESKLAQRVLIIPGNGGGDVRKANWYHWVQRQLVQAGYDAVLEVSAALHCGNQTA